MSLVIKRDDGQRIPATGAALVYDDIQHERTRFVENIT